MFITDGRCFLAAWYVSTSVIALKHDRPKPNLLKRRVSTHSDVQQRSANQQMSFSGQDNAWKKLPFQSTLPKSSEDPLFTASKMNTLHYLALQSETLVILLQDTHYTDAEKLVLSYQLAGSS